MRVAFRTWFLRLMIAVFFLHCAIPRGAAFQDTVPAWLQKPFLDVFFERSETVVTAAPVRIEGDTGAITGYLAKAAGEHLPAVLILPGNGSLDEQTKRVVQDLAATGFVSLAIDYDPDQIARGSEFMRAVGEAQVMARLISARDWLASQNSVDSARIGAFAWGDASQWVLRFAAKPGLQAAIAVGGRACNLGDEQSPPLAAILVLRGTDSECSPQAIASTRSNRKPADAPMEVSSVPAALSGFPRAAGSRAQADAVEQAWVGIYEFLAKNVEDARQPTTELTLKPENQVAKVVDIMRVINSDAGVRGNLARTLAGSPSADEWEQARSQAAILAEAGNWLLERAPAKGSREGWRRRGTEFRTAAESILHAVEARDLPAAREALRKLPASCAACHAEYR
jgi:dienelactone hydrolase